MSLGDASPEMCAYHDHEWGVPRHDDRELFEFLLLEGAQAGLSWSTVLSRRAAYYDAFHGYDIEWIARLSDHALEDLLRNPLLIRNRLKIFLGSNECSRGASRDRIEGQPERISLVIC